MARRDGWWWEEEVDVVKIKLRVGPDERAGQDDDHRCEYRIVRVVPGRCDRDERLQLTAWNEREQPEGAVIESVKRNPITRNGITAAELSAALHGFFVEPQCS